MPLFLHQVPAIAVGHKNMVNGLMSGFHACTMVMLTALSQVLSSHALGWVGPGSYSICGPECIAILTLHSVGCV